MKFSEVLAAVEGTIIHKGAIFDTADIKHVTAADLMSEVLVDDQDNLILVTALTSEQVARTADIVDALGVVLVNSKEPQPKMKKLIADMDIVCISSPLSMFECCNQLGKLIR